MKLSDLDQALALRNHRNRAQVLRRIAQDGFFDPECIDNGERMKVSSVISVELIRDAIVAECDKFIAAKEAELLALGVSV
jgi:hypothetical protein